MVDVMGLSGAKHHFDRVDGTTAIDVWSDTTLEERHIIGFYTKMGDCGYRDGKIIASNSTPKARELARSYNIELVDFQGNPHRDFSQ